MNVKEVMELLLEIPIEEHETTEVKIKMFDATSNEELTQEQHDAINVKLELFFTPTQVVGEGI